MNTFTDEALDTLTLLASYIFEPKTDMVEIASSLNKTISFLEKCLQEIQTIGIFLKEEESLEEDHTNLLTQFNDVIDKVEGAYNNWVQLSKKLHESTDDIYTLNMDMEEVKIGLANILNDITMSISFQEK